MQQAILALENGLTFNGILRGNPNNVEGEVIFNTAMSGYQEILTDPSYQGQIIAMTYPHIGNYGVNTEAMESKKVYASAMIVKELNNIPSNFKSQSTLEQFLIDQSSCILEGIDTRKLVKNLRDQGACRGVIEAVSDEDALNEATHQQLVQKAKALKPMNGRNLASIVSTQKSYEWPVAKGVAQKFHVVALDFGIKHNILRSLALKGIKVTVLPFDSDLSAIEDLKVDGVFLSNGPGDPEAVEVAVKNVKTIIGKYPIFGICLGHQILSLALGCTTYKLKFGHHGGNHPVKNIKTNRVEITSQNHGFAVDEKSLPKDVTVTHINLNDQTIEGIENKSKKLFSVQYHPEAAPGPNDASYLFDDFIALLEQNKK